MGKSGKARKKRKLTALSGTDAVGVIGGGGDGDYDDDDDTNNDNADSRVDIDDGDDRDCYDKGSSRNGHRNNNNNCNNNKGNSQSSSRIGKVSAHHYGRSNTSMFAGLLSSSDSDNDDNGDDDSDKNNSNEEEEDVGNKLGKDGFGGGDRRDHNEKEVEEEEEEEVRGISNEDCSIIASTGKMDDKVLEAGYKRSVGQKVSFQSSSISHNNSNSNNKSNGYNSKDNNKNESCDSRGSTVHAHSLSSHITSDAIQEASNCMRYMSANLDVYRSTEAKILRKALYPLIQEQKDKYFDPQAIHASSSTSYLSSTPNTAATTSIGSIDGDTSDGGQESWTKDLLFSVAKTIAALGNNLPYFNSASMKPFRRIMHPLVQEARRAQGLQPIESGISLTGEISSALNTGDWASCYENLLEMKRSGVVPKLGALQRWVRQCDEAPTRVAHVMLLSAVIGLSNPQNSNSSNGNSDSNSKSNSNSSCVDGKLTDARIIALKADFQAALNTQDNNSFPISSSSSNSSNIIKICPMYQTPIIDCCYQSDDKVSNSNSNHNINNNSSNSSSSGSSSSSSSSRSNKVSVFCSSDCRSMPITAKSRFSVVSTVKGPNRRPPSKDDMHIFGASAGAIFINSSSNKSNSSNGESLNLVGSRTCSSSSSSSSMSCLPTNARRKHEVPGVKGAFVISNVLCASECQRFIDSAEQLGYYADAVEGIDAQVWVDDSSLSLTSQIFDRCRPFLPQRCAVSGGQLSGLNPRLRFFRYKPGAVYRPHIDGSWSVGSSDVSAGTTALEAALARGEAGTGTNAVIVGGGNTSRSSRDVIINSNNDGDNGADIKIDVSKSSTSTSSSKGEWHSYMTFLVYLNGGFAGGGTSFFVPSSSSSSISSDVASVGERGANEVDREGEGYNSCIELRSVEPRAGCVLCFPHGMAEGSLVHEGSAVMEGIKYVIRTDVMYTK